MTRSRSDRSFNEQRVHETLELAHLVRRDTLRGCNEIEEIHRVGDLHRKPSTVARSKLPRLLVVGADKTEVAEDATIGVEGERVNVVRMHAVQRLAEQCVRVDDLLRGPSQPQILRETETLQADEVPLRELTRAHRDRHEAVGAHHEVGQLSRVETAREASVGQCVVKREDLAQIPPGLCVRVFVEHFKTPVWVRFHLSGSSANEHQKSSSA